MLCNRVFFNLVFWATCAHIRGVLRGARLARGASQRDVSSAVERCSIIRLASFTFHHIEIGSTEPARVAFFARQVDFIVRFAATGLARPQTAF